MSVCAQGVRIAQRVTRRVGVPVVDLPLFLCPSFIGITRGARHRRLPYSTSAQTLLSTSSSLHLPHAAKAENPAPSIAKLPPQCAGCGAVSQVIDEDSPGYYNVRRRAVNEYLKGGTVTKKAEEDEIIERSLRAAAENAPGVLSQLGFQGDAIRPSRAKVVEAPVCDRCHNIKHHDTGVSIQHPSVEAIRQTVFESPHKYNHVYHVIDAADFPMSLVPGLHKLLHLTPQRSLNRRSKTGKFYHGKKTEVSFIITRSDLLAPKKEHVDGMMPYLQAVLRDALGRAGTDVRLGNIRCVSAKQNWWTKELKEDIWKRGGGGWMVGKVNVGKSQLFGEIFPKGRRGDIKLAKPFSEITSNSLGTTATELPTVDAEQTTNSAEENLEAPPDELAALSADVESGDAVADASTVQYTPIAPEHQSAEAQESLSSLEDAASYEGTSHEDSLQEPDLESDEYFYSDSLLPPAQAETDYPDMPLVSALPGTTASPIRVPFGNGKGELIDLPGLARGDLELHVQPEHRSSLVMRSRVKPEQKVIKPGQSLLLGGFIRITPTTPDVMFLAYAFNPLKPHLTSTERAIGTQTQTREANVENIALPGTGEKIASAGTFHLKWDVTKQRTGPITAREAAGIRVEQLPYRVMAADILIEGVGWVELAAQVRKPRGSMFREKERDSREWQSPEKEEVDPEWPAVEVFSPEGKFIAARRPMNAWSYVMKPSEKSLKARPRRSMKGMKKLAKTRARASA